MAFLIDTNVIGETLKPRPEASRNTRDFAGMNVGVLDPWTSG